MAASPSSVLTRGLGSWGSVNLMVTLGYGVGAADEHNTGEITRAIRRPRIARAIRRTRIARAIKR